MGKSILLALLAVTGTRGSPVLDLAIVARAAGDGLATVALLDLALRAAPRGREAFGFVLLTGGPSFFTVFIMPMALASGRSFSSVVTLAAGAAFLAVLAVTLLPAPLLFNREGEAG